MAQCLTPITLKREYNTIDGSTHMQVPCGKCVNCVQRRVSEWAFRLEEENKASLSSAFLTLTYDDENLVYSENGYPTLSTKDHQNFMKSLRKYISKNQKLFREKYRNLKITYYAIGEYGTESYRPHYHYIIFNLPFKLIEDESIIEHIWKKGRIQVAKCTGASIRYCCGYVNKRATNDYEAVGTQESDDRLPETSYMSKGIGKAWLTQEMIRYQQQVLNPFITLQNGEKRATPRYFRYKLFNAHQAYVVRKKSLLYIEENYKEKSAKEEIETITNANRNFQKRASNKRVKI